MSVFGVKKKAKPERAGAGSRAATLEEARIAPARPEGVFSDAAWQSFTYTEHTVVRRDGKLFYVAPASERAAMHAAVQPALELMVVALVPGSATRGVFARAAIAEGTVLTEYVGLVADSGQPSEYFMDIPQGDALLPVDARVYGNVSRFLNHAKEGPAVHACRDAAFPNHVLLVASRDIAFGEQLCWDYGDMYPPFEGDVSGVSWPAAAPLEPS